MALSTEHQFIFAVFLMYGFIFMIYTLSNGAIAGLPSASVFQPSSPSTTSVVDFVISGIGIILGFFQLMFLTPLFTSTLWFIAPINWAILGTTIYLFIRILRGGG